MSDIDGALDEIDRLLNLAKPHVRICDHLWNGHDNHGNTWCVHCYVFRPAQPEPEPWWEVNENGESYCKNCRKVVPDPNVHVIGHICVWDCGLCGGAFFRKADWQNHMPQCARGRP